MTMVRVIVERGVIDVGTDFGDFAERKGRTTSWSRQLRYRVGETLELPSIEARRLQRLGVVRAVV